MTGNNELLEMFYGAFRMGDDQLGQALVNYRSELTPGLAAKASEEYMSAIQRQDLGGAYAAASIASRIYNFIGQREDAFNSLIDSFYVLYSRAETVKAYADIAIAIRNLLSGNPYGEGSPLTALRALNLAADCGFFACQAASDPDVKKQCLQAALAALGEGTKYVTSATSDLIPEYTGIAVAVYQRCVANGWVGEPWAAAPLAAVTAKLDIAVPGKVIYIGDDAKTSNIDAVRTEMSAVFNHQAHNGGEKPTSPPMSGLFGRKSSG